MEIPEKLLKFKVPILLGTAFCILISFLIYLAPSFVDILKYFWPLLVSTALFLMAVVVFGQISPPPPEASGEKAGEGILDYVAGQPPAEEQIQTHIINQPLEEEEEAIALAAKGKGKAETDKFE